MAIYNHCKVACVHSKHGDQDDNKMNKLVFVNFLLIKIFPTLICQIHQNFVPYSMFINMQCVYTSQVWLCVCENNYVILIRPRTSTTLPEGQDTCTQIE